MLAALSFLTVFGSGRSPTVRTMRWFPAVGALIGAALWAVWEATAAVSTPAVAAFAVVAADLAITGMLHLDGLADTADGLLPHLDRARRLEVMRTPDVGAFALAIVPTVVLGRWVALASNDVDGIALVSVWAISRTVMAVVPAVVPYARDDGLASPFVSGARRWLLIATVPAIGVLAARHHMPGAIAGAATIGGFAVVVATARRRIGGFTGDVLGAGAVVGETLALLVLATP